MASSTFHRISTLKASKSRWSLIEILSSESISCLRIRPSSYLRTLSVRTVRTRELPAIKTWLEICGIVLTVELSFTLSMLSVHFARCSDLLKPMKMSYTTQKKLPAKSLRPSKIAGKLRNKWFLTWNSTVILNTMKRTSQVTLLNGTWSHATGSSNGNVLSRTKSLRMQWQILT